MIKFKKIHIENGLSFKELDFSFTDYPGLNLVLGKNEVENGSNGSGKSSIFELLKYILYNTAQVARDGIINYSAKKGDGFYGEIEFEKDGVSYKVWSSRKHREHGSSAGFIDVTNNKVLQSGLRDTFPEVMKVLNYSIDEFACLTYLDQKSIHPFITKSAAGSNEVRRNILSNIYRLFYKQYLQEAKERGKEVSEKKLVLTSKIDANKDTLETLPKYDKVELEERKNEINELMIKYENRLNKLAKKINQIKEFNSLQEKQKGLNAELYELADIDENEITKHKDKLTELDRRKIELNHELDNTIEQLEIEERLHILNKKLNGYSNSNSMQELKEKLTKERNRFSKLLEVKKVVDSLKGLEVPERKLSVIEKEYNELDNRDLFGEKALLSKRISLLEKGYCSECERPFDNPEKELKTVNKQLNAVEDDIKLYKILKDEYNKAIKYNEIKSQLPKDLDINSYDKVYSNTEKKIDSIENEIEEAEEYEKVRIEFKSLSEQKKEYIDKDKIEKQIKEIKTQYIELKNKIETEDDIVKQRSIIKSKLLDIKNRLNEIELDFDESLDELVEKYDKFSSKKNKLLEELGGIDIKIESCVQRQELIKKIKETKFELDKINKKALMYDILKYIFGPDQFAKKIQKLIDGLNIKLNEYIAILFPDEFGLGFRVEMYAEGKEIQFRSYRKNRDITKLSGGEEQRIIIAFMLALREYIPENKMTNMLIIDEYDSHIDSRHKEFVLDALNMYAKKYPETHIFVITQDNTAQNTPIWNNVITVEKKIDGESVVSSN